MTFEGITEDQRQAMAASLLLESVPKLLMSGVRCV
jgi:hypothetical protein